MRKYLSLVLALGGLVFVALALILARTPLDRTWQIQHEVVIAKPIARVYDYVTTAANWPKWHPSSLKVTAVNSDISTSANVGDQIREAVRVAGRRSEMVWTVTRKEAPRLWRIGTTLENGRIQSAITYELLPVSAEQTRYRRTVAYTIHSRWLNLLHAVSLHARIENESAVAVDRLRNTLEDPKG
jgi:hypothetical protein